MNKDLIPISLHHLISSVKKWGISDDGDREHFIYSSSTEQLSEFDKDFKGFLEYGN